MSPHLQVFANLILLGHSTHSIRKKILHHFNKHTLTRRVKITTKICTSIISLLSTPQLPSNIPRACTDLYYLWRKLGAKHSDFLLLTSLTWYKHFLVEPREKSLMDFFKSPPAISSPTKSQSAPLIKIIPNVP